MDSDKRICFILNKNSRKPCGGYKMVYIYANELAERGYNVTLLHLNYNTLSRTKLPKLIRYTIANILTYMGPNWISLHSNIKCVSATNKGHTSIIKQQNIIIPTAIETVDYAFRLFPGQAKLYFIQGFENWNFSDDEVYATYAKGMTNVVISEWLKLIVDRHSGSKAIVIKNPIDLSVYKVITCPRKRDKNVIGILYHEMEHKGFKYAFECLLKLKEFRPELKVKAFGVPKRPGYFPEWVDYIQNATQEETVRIYNSVSIWLCATVEEGFGLTGLEAMACGAALVSTEYQGVFEYAENMKNALLSPVKDIELLKHNLELLLDNDELRCHIAENGVEASKNFSLKAAVDKFEEVIDLTFRGSL